MLDRKRPTAKHRREGKQVEPWVSIFLLVVGAILTFAVDVTTSGFNINTVGSS